MTNVTREFVEGLPKVELHVHVEACISADTIEELAASLDVPMIRPKDELFRYSSLAEFLSIYEWWVDLLRTPEIAEQVAYNAARQMHDDGIVYAELFTGPRYWAHVEDHEQIEALCRGFGKARRDGYTDCYLIPSISREQSAEWSMDLVNWMAGVDRVVGLGLDGNEEILGRTSHKFVDVFARAAELGLGRSAHCGESSGAWGVWDGLDLLKLDRIDHGVRAIEDPVLVKRLAEDRIPLTICPTSNVIVGLHNSVADGPVDALFRAGVAVTVNSDDPQSMQVSINDDLMRVSEAFDWSVDDVLAVQENAIEGAYCDAGVKAELRQNQRTYAKSQGIE